MTPRPSFRHRLVVTLGAGLAAGLAVIGVALWLTFHVRANVLAQRVLEHEASEIAAAITTDRGTLEVDAYEWDEPHHTFAEPRIDPFFTQVFDGAGRLLHVSPNVARVAGYPARLLDVRSAGEVRLLRLPTRFRAGGARFYAVVRPIRTEAGATAGYVQIGRYDPGLVRDSVAWGASLALGLALALGGLLLVVHSVARRVVGPLETITAAALEVSAAHLDQRVPIPPNADRESAQLADTLNARLDELEASFEEMRRFTSRAAHELQTPVARLLGHADVTLRRHRTAEAYRETLITQRAELVRVSTLVRSLLLLSRLDRDALDVETEPVDLGALIAEEVRLVQETARDRGLSLRVTVAPEAVVQGHPTLLRELLRILLDNAIKYTPQGGVSIDVERNDRGVVLTVQDTGRGIDPEDLPHVTAQFYRAASVQSEPGHGLGLALAQRIAEMHRTNLELASAPGVGTSVHIVLPPC